MGRPGSVDSNNFIQFVRVDRVNYDDKAPWPTYPDGAGPALTKIAEKEYGNDYINWTSSAASPGDIAPGDRYDTWAATHGIANQNSDDDGDGLTGLMEYAFNTDPYVANHRSPLAMTHSGGDYSLTFDLNLLRSDVDLVLQSSTDLQNWTTLTTTPTIISSTAQTRSAELTTDGPQRFHRLQVVLKP